MTDDDDDLLQQLSETAQRVTEAQAAYEQARQRARDAERDRQLASDALEVERQRQLDLAVRAVRQGHARQRVVNVGNVPRVTLYRALNDG